VTLHRGRRSLRLLAASLLAAIVAVPLAAGSTEAATTGAKAAAAANAVCGQLSTTAPPTTYKHVIWIWMENHPYIDIIGAPGSTQAANSPFVNATAAQCGLATNYHNITHPSLPNYLASVAGTTGGVTSDCGTNKCPQNSPTIFSQLVTAKKTWRGYAESMPSNCALFDSGTYAARHNPAVYYTNIRTSCATSDLPMGTTASGAFKTALTTNTLPSFTFVTPNLCSDTHDCSIRTGDNWLASWLPLIVNSPGYTAGGTAVFLTWDEGERGSTNACATNTTDIGCRVATLVISPYTVPGTRSTTLYNHYSLLRTTEYMLGLPLLAHAADATSHGMRGAFHL
jgi:phosphatidylinositol-3-phosphatase